MGYQTMLGPNCFEGSGIGISNTPEKCAAELNKMYLSDEADALISCGGGELMCEILDDVDFDATRQQSQSGIWAIRIIQTLPFY